MLNLVISSMKYTAYERSKGSSGNICPTSLWTFRIRRDTSKERYAIMMHCMQHPYMSCLQVWDFTPGDIYLLKMEPHDHCHGYCTVKSSNMVKLIHIYQPHIGNKEDVMKVGMSYPVWWQWTHTLFSCNLIMTLMSSSDPGSALHVCIVTY